MIHMRRITVIPDFMQMRFRSPQAAAAAGSATLISDTFTDSNGVLIKNHTPDINVPGNSWIGDYYDIQSNRLSGDATYTGALINVGQTDYTVSCKVSVTGISSFTRGLLVRSDGTTALAYFCGVVYSGNLLRIGSTTNNDLASTAMTITPGVEYTLTVVCSGSTITLSCGELSVEYNSAVTAGRSYVGSFMRYDADYIDDLLVEVPETRDNTWALSGGVSGANLIACYQPKGAPGQASSYLDLSGNDNHAGVGVAPTWDAVNGWIFNGSTQYLTTAFVPQNDQSQSVLIQYSGYTNQVKCLFGQYDGASQSLRLLSENTGIYAANGGVAAVAGVFSASGNHGIAGNRYYKNGTATGGVIGVWDGASTLPCWIGQLNGLAGYFIAINIQALAIYDTTLTADQVLAVSNAMAAL